MKQTAVEWLAEELERIDHEYHIDSFEYRDARKTASQIANTMFQEQIEDAYWEGGQDVPVNAKQCESYYNETFKSE